MKLDSSNSHSTADETKCFQTTENNEFQEGIQVPGPGEATGSEVETCTQANTDVSVDSGVGAPLSWCYLFVHHQKVKFFEKRLKRDNRTYFIHTSIKYAPKRGDGKKVKKVTVPTVSGLIFLQGRADEIQRYLDWNFPLHRLCKNCSTGRVAEIPDSQMVPFMRIVKSDPDRIRFLLRPFVYYSQNRTLLRIVSGDFAGLEGYVIRIARDRRLVMDVGGMSVAIAGIHAERFEEVGKNEADKKERATFYKRNLHERNAFIDRYFHKISTVQEVAAQAENIDILRVQTLADMDSRRIDIKAAYETFHFIIEEIGYYYAPFADRFKDGLQPIFEAGSKVMDGISTLIASIDSDTEMRQRYEAEYEELENNYGYLFE